MSFWKDVADLRAAQEAYVKNHGGKISQRELRAAMKANLKNGRGNRSMIEALEQMGQQQTDQPTSRPSHLKRTFALSFLFGALWQGSRRRR